MMRIFRRGSGLALCLCLAACSQLNELDVDETADFASFDSFSVNSAELPANHPALGASVDNAIAAQLSSKGMKHTTASDASLNVRYFLTVREYDASDAETTTAGELILDVQDSVTGDVIWRSRSERKVPVVRGDESVMAESVGQWVTDVLRAYPDGR